MLSNIIYLIVFLILAFVLSIAVKAITRGVEAKQIIKEEKNLDLSNENENPFKLQKKIQDNKEMPSLYLLESIRNASKENNQIRLLFNIILSIDGKKWIDIHPEHLRIILLNLI